MIVLGALTVVRLLLQIWFVAPYHDDVIGYHLPKIAEWVPESETGDRGEIEDLPDETPLWSELSATTDQCLGRECSAYARWRTSAPMRARPASR